MRCGPFICKLLLSCFSELSRLVPPSYSHFSPPLSSHCTPLAKLHASAMHACMAALSEQPLHEVHTLFRNSEPRGSMPHATLLLDQGLSIRKNQPCDGDHTWASRGTKQRVASSCSFLPPPPKASHMPSKEI